jgi:hypothetical protein
MTKATDEEIEAQAKLAFDPPNLTQQMLLVKLLGDDLAKAAEIAKQYGGEIGTLIQKRPEKIAGATNPWSDKYRGPPAEAEAEKARILRTGGTKFASALAKAAGVTVLFAARQWDNTAARGPSPVCRKSDSAILMVKAAKDRS